MTPRDFVYWLQAYFEIPEHKQPVVLTARQVKIIQRHLAMLPVAKYNQKTVCVPNYGKGFCDWLDVYLKESEDVLSPAGTLKIKQHLDDLFEHVA